MMHRVLVLIALLTGVLLAGTAAFTDEGATQGREARLSAWEDQLSRAAEDLEKARTRLQEAEAAYRKARQRQYPRGEKLAEMIEEIEKAKVALAEAEETWPDVFEAVRRDGAPRGLLRRYEHVGSPPASADD